MPSPQLIHALNSIGSQRQTFGKGEFVFLAGNYPEFVFLVESGGLRLLGKGSPDYSEAMATPPSRRRIWGLKELVLEKAFGLSGEALEETIVLMIGRDQVLNLTKSNPTIRLELMQYIAKEINEHHAFVE